MRRGRCWPTTPGARFGRRRAAGRHRTGLPRHHQVARLSSGRTAKGVGGGEEVEPRGVEPRSDRCDRSVIPLDHGPVRGTGAAAEGPEFIPAARAIKRRTGIAHPPALHIRQIGLCPGASCLRVHRTYAPHPTRRPAATAGPFADGDSRDGCPSTPAHSRPTLFSRPRNRR